MDFNTFYRKSFHKNMNWYAQNKSNSIKFYTYLKGRCRAGDKKGRKVSTTIIKYILMNLVFSYGKYNYGQPFDT